MLRPNMAPTLGVILDVDGTLVDTNDARAHAWTEALRDHGHDLKYKEIRKLVGLAPHEMLVRTTGLGVDTDQGKVIRDRAQAVFHKRLLSRVTAFYRARELLYMIQERGLRIAVSSVDPPETLLPILKILGAEPLIHRAAHLGKLPPTATNRDLLKAALDKLGVPNGNTVFLADAPHDIVAASKLSIPTVALRTGGFPDADLKGAAAVYDDARALLAVFDRSPLAPGAPPEAPVKSA